MRPVLIAPVLVVLALAAATSAAREPLPDATPVGKAESCIPLHSIRQSRVRSDSVIDIETTGGRVYRNVLPHACPSLGFEERFSYQTSLDRLCSTDIITVIQSPPGISGPSCGLGEFQPVTLAKRARR